MKAAEWRLIATMYLPLALISLWGDGFLDSSDQSAVTLHSVLDHTMLLCTALHIGCMRIMTKQRIEAYRAHITRFVQDLQNIHPHANFYPNHHMAQHIYDFLYLFGPVQSWWCFPFERLIGLLQHLPQNHKSGKISISRLFVAMD
jgi:hypothetical protein